MTRPTGLSGRGYHGHYRPAAARWSTGYLVLLGVAAVAGITLLLRATLYAEEPSSRAPFTHSRLAGPAHDPGAFLRGFGADRRRNSLQVEASEESRPAVTTQDGGGTLVLYVRLTSDEPEHEANFRHFLRWGLAEGDGATYIILVDSSLDLHELPWLPSNARYVKAATSTCYYGAVGTLLASREVQAGRFSAFIVLNSSLRGPFLPAYAQEGASHWTRHLTSRLGRHVKLVGPTITCSRVYGDELALGVGGKTNAPHVAWSMWATDAEGLNLLMREGDVFSCGNSTYDSENLAALKASLAMLSAGYNLDCLMLRYQGVEWGSSSSWGCNAGLEVTGESYYDSINLHPLEVMFVEVDGLKLAKALPAARSAKRYDRWRGVQAAGDLDVRTNLYAFDPTPFRARSMAYMEQRGPGCFDLQFYKTKNSDLDGLQVLELWNHFVQAGQFEDRPYRFNCLDMRARGVGCFDAEYYNRHNEDLNSLRLEGRGLSPEDAWSHFLRMGFFEGRAYRFKDICAEDIDSPNTIGDGVAVMP